ncbi:DUF6470 family protein [Desertibacillus haloalkaliphilus]|uniref:DUF6470 family protein n=1 Tax=Desertibacillus haloalkaliphilus TaxID=1328930 RepID=UPI001C2617F8|nr:DUF6470 family protein [Desertibacillus haloalkaliphilus]MBU8905988.1 hypothetical protein [Desertibacillus haloalkaliphilus]
MQVPSIQISTTNAKIGIQTNRPTLEIKQPHADVQIRQEHFDHVHISRRAAKLYIDQSEAFADAGLKSAMRVNEEAFEKGKQKALQYMAKVSQEGDRLMKIENGGGQIPQIAKANSDLMMKELGLGFVPSSPFKVKFNYDPGELSFNYRRSDPEINITKNDPIINIPKWQTDIYLQQKPSISFSV